MTIAISNRRVLMLAAVLALLGVIAYLVVARARNGGELTLYGNVDIRETTLGFRVAGRLASLAVDEGAVVHAGDVLARLDVTPIELEAREARAAARAAASRAALLKAGFRREDVEQARATVLERRAAALTTEQTLARQLQLRGTGAVAEHVYDDALAARDESQARLRAAEQALAQFERGYRREEVAEADANRERALAVAEQAEQRLADAVLRAPADAVVLTRAAEPGTILAAGTTVFTLSLSAPVWARVYVAEPDLGRARPGREALIYTDSRPARPYHGVVGFVSPTAEFTPKNVETPELRTALVYRARVVVNDPDPELRQGMPVSVRFVPGDAGGGARQ